MKLFTAMRVCASAAMAAAFVPLVNLTASAQETTPAPAPVPAPAAVVLQYKGSVQYLPAGTKDWQTVQQTNLALNVGAHIYTRQASEAVLKLGGESLVTLREMTYMVIKSASDQDTTLEMTQGRSLLKVKRQTETSTFSVRTPAAVAGVRGTVFVVESDAQKNARVTVADGAVAVTGTVPDSRTVTAEKGQTVLVVFNAQPQDPRVAEIKDMEELQGYMQQLESLNTLGGGFGQVGQKFAEHDMKQMQEAGANLEEARQVKKGDAKIKEDMAAIKAAFMKCFQETGYLPPQDDKKFDETSSQLVMMLIEGKDPQGKPIPGWKGPYLQGNLKDPFGRYYKVRYAENVKGDGRFEVFSLGLNPADKNDDPLPLFLRLDQLVGPDGQHPPKPVRATK